MHTDTVMFQTGHGDGVRHVHLAGVQPLPSECHSLGPVGLVHPMSYVASFLTWHTLRRMARRWRLPWRWELQNDPTLHYNFSRRHGVTSQKTETFIMNIVGISDQTFAGSSWQNRNTFHGSVTVLYLLTLSVNGSDCTTLIVWLVDSEVKRAWNEAIETSFGNYSRIFLEWLKKTVKNFTE
jgi:hypothetical protein